MTFIIICAAIGGMVTKLKNARESAYEFYDMGLPIEKIAKGFKVSIETVQEWLADREAVPVK